MDAFPIRFFFVRVDVRCTAEEAFRHLPTINQFFEVLRSHWHDGVLSVFGLTQTENDPLWYQSNELFDALGKWIDPDSGDDCTAPLEPGALEVRYFDASPTNTPWTATHRPPEADPDDE